jgi:hypothetical protein
MQTLDIVNLIETNPITKLTNAYNNKLLNKIKENFTETEQQLFISSFFCYLNYNSTTDFVIDLDNIWKWLGFGQKINAKRVLEKNFVVNVDYKNLLCQLAKQDNDNKKHGGHNKELIYLTIKTFKLFCIKAETKKANEIHEYFIKLEEILQQTIEEESNEFKLQLQEAKQEIEKIENQKNQEIEQIEEKNKKEMNEKVQKEKEKMLLRDFGSSGALVYIIKVKTYENGEYVIKIGESRRGVQLRYNEHKSKYGEILLLDCFSVVKSKDFETFLHEHESIKINRVVNLEGHENERELFLVGNKLSYSTILQIIQSNLKKFNEYSNSDYEKLQTQLNTYKEMIISNPLTSKRDENDCFSNQNLQINQILENQTKLLEKIAGLEKSNKEILEKLNSAQTKTTTGFQQPLPTLGPRLQKINPETLNLVKVYESVAECIKEYNFTVKRPSLDKAVKENIIYHEYRWLYVEREKDSNIIENIQPTKQSKTQNLGYIAKLNMEKTEILNVYLDRKTACRYNNYPSLSSLDNPVKNETASNGNYYFLYDKCSEELKNDFVEKCGEPLLYKDGVGQYDGNNHLIQEFVCKYDCIKKLKISDKTLAKALDKNVLYNNFYFKTMGVKDKWL